MGWSAGLTLLKDGGVGMPGGQRAGGLRDGRLHVHRGAVEVPAEVEFQDELGVLPRELVEDMVMPAMVENWLSSGVATAEAMVSGLAPGSEAAVTDRVGKSTLGRSLTGSAR